MAKTLVLRIDFVEIIQDVSLALLRTLKGSNLKYHGRGLRKPGETRLYRNVARNRWRALTLAGPGKFFVWTPQIDDPGRLSEYAGWAEFFAEHSEGGVREACEEDARDGHKRDERMVRRRRR